MTRISATPTVIAQHLHVRSNVQNGGEEAAVFIGCHRGVSLLFVRIPYRFVTTKQCILSMFGLRMFLCSA